MVNTLTKSIIFWNSFVSNTFNLKPIAHARGKLFWETAREFGSVFGLPSKMLSNRAVLLRKGCTAGG
jgi:hypothetical protein